jgi:hypothetical protein
MRIIVTSAVLGEDGLMRVWFECAAGRSVACWKSAHIQPSAGMIYDVELDLEGPVEVGHNARFCASGPPYLAGNGGVTMRTSVEDADEDGMLYLRLTDDCLVMAESTGEVLAGTTLELSFSDTSVFLTPIGPGRHH